MTGEAILHKEIRGISRLDRACRFSQWLDEGDE